MSFNEFITLQPVIIRAFPSRLLAWKLGGETFNSGDDFLGGNVNSGDDFLGGKVVSGVEDLEGNVNPVEMIAGRETGVETWRGNPSK